MSLWIFLCCLPMVTLAMSKCENGGDHTECSYLDLKYDQPIIVNGSKEHLLLTNCTGDIGKITLSMFQHVTRLCITGGNITGLEDGALCSLPKLQRISMRNSSDNFPTLTRKRLSGCHSVDSLAIDVPIEEDSFADLSNLKDLILYNQTIPHLTKQYFQPLKRLRFLDVMHLKISRIDDNAICVSSNLEIIDMKVNKFPNLTESMFSGCKNVTHLTLMNLGDEASFMEERAFNDIPSLTFLEIHKFHLAGVLTKSFTKDFGNIKTLGLKNCNIYEIQNDAFIHTPKLKTLYLALNNLSRIDLSTFQNLSYFKSLYLSYNKLEAIEFHLLPHISTLGIGNNLITDLDFEILIQNLPLLQFIELEGNPLNENFKKDFEKQKRVQEILLDIQPNTVCCSREYWFRSALMISTDDRLEWDWLLQFAER